MEKKFQKVLDFFSEPKTQHISEEYIKKYWLNEIEIQGYWKPLKDKIFRSRSTYLPDIMFEENFKLIALIGGVIFTENEFKSLQNCMLKAGDRWFVIIENKHMQPIVKDNNDKNIIQPLLNFKFPIDITWQELINGGFVSLDLFETSYKEFFVFGDSAKWGKYVANEYCNISVSSLGTPLDIIGFKPELAPIFEKHFKQSREEQEEIRKWLPQEYKNLIKL